MEGSGAGASKQDNPEEVEEMQREWENFFGQDFPDVEISPEWVNQMRNEKGQLLHPDNIRYGDKHPRAGQKITPRELANQVISFQDMTNTWRAYQNRTATDMARYNPKLFEETYTSATDEAGKPKYPDLTINYDDDVTFRERLQDAARGVGSLLRGTGDFASKILPNTTETIKDKSTGSGTLQGALVRDTGQIIGGAFNRDKAKDLDGNGEVSRYEQYVHDYNKGVVWDAQNAAERDWVQQGRPEVYQHLEGGDAADHIDRMTKEMLVETGMRNYLNELSKTLPEAVGAVSGGASDLAGGSAPSIALALAPAPDLTA